MKKLILVLLIGLLALAGCKGEEGTQTVARSKCSGSSGPNVCTLTLVSIQGTMYRHDFKNKSFWQGTSEIEITARITVERGAVQFWVEDWEKNRTLVVVEPGQTAELKGIAAVMPTTDGRFFSVYFEPLGEAKRAENVQAEIRYDTQRPKG